MTIMFQIIIVTARRYASAVSLYAVVVYPTVCPSVTYMYMCCRNVSVYRYCIETTCRIELVFDLRASFYLYYTVLSRNSGTSKNNGTSLCNFVPNLT